jgi:hypothetical protein
LPGHTRITPGTLEGIRVFRAGHKGKIFPECKPPTSGRRPFFVPLPKEKIMSSDFFKALAGMDAITFLGLFSLILAALLSLITLIRHALGKGEKS